MRGVVQVAKRRVVEQVLLRGERGAESASNNFNVLEVDVLRPPVGAKIDKLGAALLLTGISSKTTRRVGIAISRVLNVSLVALDGASVTTQTPPQKAIGRRHGVVCCTASANLLAKVGLLVRGSSETEKVYTYQVFTMQPMMHALSGSINPLL